MQGCGASVLIPHLQAAARGNIKLKFRALGQLPATEHEYAVAIREDMDVRPHVFAPVGVDRHAVIKGVDRHSALCLDVFRRTQERPHALGDVVVRYRAADVYSLAVHLLM